MIYLDTHVVIWLYEGALEKIPMPMRELLNTESLKISPMVRLELQFLEEIGRLKAKADTILSELYYTLQLEMCREPLVEITHQAMGLNWTRDPFDRLIVATALFSDARLMSKDQHILAHYPKAIWG